MIKVALAFFSLAIGSAALAGPPAEYWQIGPIVRGENSSVGMPATMRSTPDGPAFDFSGRGGEVHYVTAGVRSLEGATSMRIRYRIDARPGTKFVAADHPTEPPYLSLYFQRRGDNWTARGRYETYRWYVRTEHMLPLTPGTHEVVVDFKDDWRAVMRTQSRDNPRAFKAALNNASQVGFVFGSVSGRGHGVYSTAPATFTLLDFDIR